MTTTISISQNVMNFSLLNHESNPVAANPVAKKNIVALDILYGKVAFHWINFSYVIPVGHSPNNYEPCSNFSYWGLFKHTGTISLTKNTILLAIR